MGAVFFDELLRLYKYTFARPIEGVRPFHLPRPIPRKVIYIAVLNVCASELEDFVFRKLFMLVR